MYLKYFGLDRAPFAITPDPGFVFLSSRHEDALAHLVYGVSRGGGGGFVQLTGEVGTGKTTLCRLLLEQVPDETRVALILNPAMTPKELIASTLTELEIPFPVRATHKRLVDILNEYLLKAHADGARVVLMIDEAQNLTPQALEQVRLLTNLETHTEKLLQIILIGQPELRELLRRRDLRQLAQRVTARYHLEPLDAGDTEAYVDHRLQVAGAQRNPFSPGALRVLHRRARGVPRLINIIAERALLGAFSLDRERVSARLVNAAADEVMPARRRWGQAVALGAAAVLLIGSASAYIWQRQQDGAVGPAMPPAAETSDVAAKPLPQINGESAAGALLANLWGETAPNPEGCRPVPAPGWRCVELSGNVNRLRAINRPALLHSAVNPDQWMLVTGLDDEFARLLSGDGDSRSVPWPRVDTNWSGDFRILYPVHELAPVVLEPGQSHAYVPTLREQLGVTGSGNTYDPDLVRAVREVQQGAGLTVDGSIGPLTLLALGSDTGQSEPTLQHENH